MTRIRDQQLLTFAATTVWAADAALRPLIISILGRHYRGERLTRDELDEIKQATPRRQPRQAADGGGVAVIPLWGPLVPKAGMMVDVSTEGTGLDSWRQMLQSAVDDPNVGTILLQVNSPGGSVAGVTETAAAIRAARAKKRVVAVADEYAASAGYALASQADTLLVTPSGQVGAIHCYLIHEDISEMLAANGIRPTLIAEPDNGENELTEFLALTDDQRAHLQQTVRHFYDTFVQDVAKGRGVSASTVEATFGRGRVMTAPAALAAGMVDGIATFDDTLERLVAGKALPGARQAATLTELVASAAEATRPLLQPGNASVTPTEGGAGGLASLVAYSFTSPTLPAAGPTAVPPQAPEADSTTERSTTMEPVSIDGRPPTLEELAAQKDRNNERLTALNDQAAGRMFSAEEEAEFAELTEQVETIDKTIAQLKQRQATLTKLAKSSAALPGDGGVPISLDGGGITIITEGVRGLPDNLWDLQAYRRFAGSHDQLGQKMADGAKAINEKLVYATQNPDRARHLVEKLLTAEANSDEQDGASREGFATRFLVTSAPDYEKQFATWLRTGRDTDRPRMAVSIGGLGNETPVPVTIDPTVLLDSDGAISAIRRLARNVTITGNIWRGIASEGVTIEYEGELAEVDPQTPTFRAPEAHVEKAQAEVQFSIEVDQDWPSFREELARMFRDAKNVKEAHAFLFGTGHGTNQPEGLIYALDVDDTSVVPTATANTLAIGDVRGLVAEIPPRFEESAAWLASRAFYAQANALSRAESNFDIWVPFSQGFAAPQDGSLRYQLLGYPTASASEMSSAFTTGGENVAVLGDFQRGFIIVDRVGLNVELDPLVRNSSGKLFGARALYFYFRNTSKLLSANAFRMLQIKAT